MSTNHLDFLIGEWDACRQESFWFTFFKYGRNRREGCKREIEKTLKRGHFDEGREIQKCFPHTHLEVTKTFKCQCLKLKCVHLPPGPVWPYIFPVPPSINVYITQTQAPSFAFPFLALPGPSWPSRSQRVSL